MPITNYHTIDGEILAESTADSRRDYATDALGSVTGVIDSSGAQVLRLEYKPYGLVLEQIGTAPLPRFRWNGSWGYLAESPDKSMTYVRARHLSMSNHTWTSVDPLWPAEWPYAYVRGNVTTFADGTGTKGGQATTDLELNPALRRELEELYRRILEKEGKEAARRALLQRLRTLGFAASVAGLIIAIIIAVVDLGRFVCTGQTGPLTGIGKRIGEELYPDPQDDFVYEDKKSNCRQRCIRRWMSHLDWIKGSRILSKKCKTRLLQHPQDWLTDCRHECWKNCNRTGSMESSKKYKKECNTRWAKKMICEEKWHER